jgi:hypothetical protein
VHAYHLTVHLVARSEISLPLINSLLDVISQPLMFCCIQSKPPAGPTLDQKVTAALQWLLDNPGKSVRSAAHENNAGESTLRARLKGGRSCTEEMTSQCCLSKAETG